MEHLRGKAWPIKGGRRFFIDTSNEGGGDIMFGFIISLYWWKNVNLSSISQSKEIGPIKGSSTWKWGFTMKLHSWFSPIFNINGNIVTFGCRFSQSASEM